MLDPKNLKNNSEQFEEFYPAGKKRIPQNKMVQYDYRNGDGELFSCVAKSLSKAREKCSAWRMKKLAETK